MEVCLIDLDLVQILNVFTGYVTFSYTFFELCLSVDKNNTMLTWIYSKSSVNQPRKAVEKMTV